MLNLLSHHMLVSLASYENNHEEKISEKHWLSENDKIHNTEELLIHVENVDVRRVWQTKTGPECEYSMLIRNETFINLMVEMWEVEGYTIGDIMRIKKFFWQCLCTQRIPWALLPFLAIEIELNFI